MHTLVVQVYALAGHAHVGTCTCISTIYGFVNNYACCTYSRAFGTSVLSFIVSGPFFLERVTYNDDFVHAIGYHAQSLISKCLKILTFVFVCPWTIL